jgi:DNA polymerase III epsilon subunit-like protein
MRLQVKKTRPKNIIIFDIEYDQTMLVQLAFLILTKKEPTIFELTKSFNVYVKPNRPLTSFFTRYTNITNDFLCDNGVDLPVAKALVDEVMLNIDLNDSLIVSHGVQNDLELLLVNGIDFKQIREHYCTYNSAKKLLQRNNHLTLQEVAAEGGYYMFDAHNAYADVWGTLYAFCHLKEIENGSVD